MGNCNPYVGKLLKQTKQEYLSIVKKKDDIWEIPRANIVKLSRAGKIPKKALSKSPLLCNYLILNRDGNSVTNIKMNGRRGSYKQYTTRKSLKWHIDLINMPDVATITLSDIHYKYLL
jgi:hypothetical protein